MNPHTIILLHLLFSILNRVTLLPLQSLADQLTNSSESTTAVINSTTLLSTEATIPSGNFTVTDNITTTTDFPFNSTTNGCGINTTTVSDDTDINEIDNSLVIDWDASRRVPNYVMILLLIFMISVLLTIAGLAYSGCQLRRVKAVPESRVISSRTVRLHEPIPGYKSSDAQ